MPIVWNNPEVALKKELKPLSLSDMAAQGERCSEMLDVARRAMLSPDSKKKAPIFSADKVADSCGLTKAAFDYRIKKLLAVQEETAGASEDSDSPALPVGAVEARGAPRRFTLAEARQWIKANRPQPARLAGEVALAIAVLNTKGGVAKTSTAFGLAQGLTLRGLNCLLVDADPQASATTLTGTVPERDIDWDQTVCPFVYGDQPDLTYAVQETYWDGLDIIPSSSVSYSAEWRITAESAKGRARLWDWFTRGLEPLRKHYDAIIIDTSPALQNLTINSVFAADGLIVPSPPTAIDFAAGAQFWTLFGGLLEALGERVQASALHDKLWQFVYVLPTMVDPTAQSYPLVREWMTDTYGTKIPPAEILSSKVAATLSANFQTVYDVGGRYEGNVQSYRRLRDGYDRLAEVIDTTLANVRTAQRKAGV